MGKPSDYPGFKALLQEWNQKLKDSGFKDIEEPVGDDLVLKRSGSDHRLKLLLQDTIAREARAKYYEIIGERIVNTSFDNETEKKILTLYYEGVSQGTIQKILGIKGHRCKIYRPIHKWLKRWGLK